VGSVLVVSSSVVVVTGAGVVGSGVVGAGVTGAGVGSSVGVVGEYVVGDMLSSLLSQHALQFPSVLAGRGIPYSAQ
jgi:hypothetical protein